MQRAVSTLPALVARTISRHGMLHRGERVLVAVSGGSDSVGLLAVLSRLRRRLGITLTAAHVNHRLRGADADADEQCAAENADRLGIPFVRTELSRSLVTESNLEARARTQRYAALHQLAATADCRTIATGHTRDDQAETVLLRLVRGSGPAGLAGVLPKRRDGVVRPLIERTRAEVEAFVRAEGLRFRVDASNADARFRRARIRHEVLPLLRQLNPAVGSRLARAAALFDAERPIVAAWVEEQVTRATHGDRLDVARLAEIPPPLRGHVIRGWISRAASLAAPLTAAHVDVAVRLAMGHRPNGSVTIGGGLVIRRRYGALLLGGEAPPQPLDTQPLHPGETILLRPDWRIAAGPLTAVPAGRAMPDDLWSALCDAEGLDAFAVRSARVGDRLRPLGLGGSRTLADVFTDRKVPLSERQAYPVVEWAGQIVWVPGLVRSEVLLVSAQTHTTVALVAARSDGDR